MKYVISDNQDEPHLQAIMLLYDLLIDDIVES